MLSHFHIMSASAYPAGPPGGHAPGPPGGILFYEGPPGGLDMEALVDALEDEAPQEEEAKQEGGMSFPPNSDLRFLDVLTGVYPAEQIINAYTPAAIAQRVFDQWAPTQDITLPRLVVLSKLFNVNIDSLRAIAMWIYKLWSEGNRYIILRSFAKRGVPDGMNPAFTGGMDFDTNCRCFTLDKMPKWHHELPYNSCEDVHVAADINFYVALEPIGTMEPAASIDAQSKRIYTNSAAPGMIVYTQSGHTFPLLHIQELERAMNSVDQLNGTWINAVKGILTRRDGGIGMAEATSLRLMSTLARQVAMRMVAAPADKRPFYIYFVNQHKAPLDQNKATAKVVFTERTRTVDLYVINSMEKAAYKSANQEFCTCCGIVKSAIACPHCKRVVYCSTRCEKNGGAEHRKSCDPYQTKLKADENRSNAKGKHAKAPGGIQ